MANIGKIDVTGVEVIFIRVVTEEEDQISYDVMHALCVFFGGNRRRIAATLRERVKETLANSAWNQCFYGELFSSLPKNDNPLGNDSDTGEAEA